MMNFIQMSCRVFETESPVDEPQVKAPEAGVILKAEEEQAVADHQHQQEEAEQAAGGVVDVAEVTPAITEAVCSICYEPEGVTVSNVCSNDSCKFCEACFQSYAKLMVEKAWACPEMKCPGCKERMETTAWQSHAAQAEVSMYNHRLKHIVGVRCPSCHTPKSMFIDTAPEEGERAAAKAALIDAKAESKVEQAEAGAVAELEEGLRQYMAGEVAPRAMVDCLLSHVGGQVEALAGLVSPALWCALAGDVERRTSLQLAWYRVSPKVATPCCARTMCFKCQTRDWHEGKTCAEMEEGMNLDTMLCPACDVAIMKSEGCSHMICPCGKEFTWNPAQQRAEREAAEAARRAAAAAEARRRSYASCLAHVLSLGADNTVIEAEDGDGDGDAGEEEGQLVVLLERLNRAQAAARASAEQYEADVAQREADEAAEAARRAEEEARRVAAEAEAAAAAAAAEAEAAAAAAAAAEQARMRGHASCLAHVLSLGPESTVAQENDDAGEEEGQLVVLLERLNRAQAAARASAEQYEAGVAHDGFVLAMPLGLLDDDE